MTKQTTTTEQTPATVKETNSLPVPDNANLSEGKSKIKNEDDELKKENETLSSENEKLRELIQAQEKPVYPVVIPYLKSQAQGDELKLAITGWLKHFKERFKIIVVGDREDFFNDLTEEIIHIPHECVGSDPQLDIISKLKCVISNFPEFENLILTNDDIYPINDFDITTVKLLKVDGRLSDHKTTGEVYAVIRKRTLALLEKLDKTDWDYGCHLPVFIGTARLLDLVERFNLEEQPYLLSSLYFNYFFPSFVPQRLDLLHDNLKVGVYRENADLKKLEELIPQKIWINNSVTGWTPSFAEFMDRLMK